ncbi:hypothetical protein MUG91_G115n14 [Manis pentadactyla]|nr:hypothetical protein MUG91_G115n14 [Manis pentadactyla]
MNPHRREGRAGMLVKKPAFLCVPMALLCYWEQKCFHLCPGNKTAQHHKKMASAYPLEHSGPCCSHPSSKNPRVKSDRRSLQSALTTYYSCSPCLS